MATNDTYIITRERVLGFADQARRLGGVEDELTVEQMQAIFEGVTAGNKATIDGETLVLTGVTVEGETLNM